MARIGVVTFPGSLDDWDAQRAVKVAGGQPVALWHASDELDAVDAVILPGGFSYGDYLRCGAIARFAPIMSEVVRAAKRGLPVLGICNGFQILCEAGLLPGTLMRNESQLFTCIEQKVRVETISTAWTCDFKPKATVAIPLKNGEGNYQADEETLKQLEDDRQVAFRYIGNPNGSSNDIAGVTNKAGNVVGLMPHPEYAIDALTGVGTDGLTVFTSAVLFVSGAN